MDKKKYWILVLVLGFFVCLILQSNAGFEGPGELKKSIKAEQVQVEVIIAELSKNRGLELGIDFDLCEEAKGQVAGGQYGEAYKNVRSIKGSIHSAVVEALKNGDIPESVREEILELMGQIVGARIEVVTKSPVVHKLSDDDLSEIMRLKYQAVQLELLGKYDQSYSVSEANLKKLNPSILILLRATGDSEIMSRPNIITINPEMAVIAVEEEIPYTATLTTSSGSGEDVTDRADWTSSNTSVATIDQGGTARGVSTGQTQIKASLGGIESEPAQLSVTDGRLESIDIFHQNPSVRAGRTIGLNAVGKSADGTEKDGMKSQSRKVTVRKQ